MSVSWPIKVDFEENVNPYPGSATDPDIISGGQNSSSYAMNSGSSNNKSWHLKDSSYNWVSDVKAISFWHKPVAKTGTNDGDLPVIFMAHEDDTRPTGWDNGSWLYFAMDLISSSGKYYIHQKSNKSCASKWYINGVEAVESGTAEKIASDFTGSVYVAATMDTWTHHYIEFHVTMKHLIFMNDYNANNDRYRGTGSIDNIYFLNEAQTTSTISDLSNNIPFDKSLTDISNNFLISSSLVTTKEIDDYFESITGLLTFNQTESNTFFTDLSNNSLTNPIMTYIGFKIVKIKPSLGGLVGNSLYTSLDTANDSFTFDNLVEATTNSIFDASNNADISGGDTTPSSIEKAIFKNAKTLSFRKLRKDLKSNELETKIKDISTEDDDNNLITYLNNINLDLSLNLTGFDLSGVDLTGTDLSGATLVDTDLSGANLTNANLTSVDISGANITNVNLKNATFTDISNVQEAVGVAINIPYTYQYFNNRLTQSTTNLTQSYTTNKTKIGPFKDGESIVVNGVQLTFGEGVGQAGLLGVDKNQDGDSFTFLQDDNNITTWGNTYTGGSQPTDISNVKAIFSTKRAKTALYEDGKIMSWGDSDYGGQAPSEVNGLIDVKSNEKAFVGLYHNGTITCWGDASTGGTTPSNVNNVVQLYSNKNAFAALSSDGTVKSWGSLNSTTPPTDNKFVDIFSTDTAFAGLKSDGTVKCWGSADSAQNTPPIGLTNVSVIFSNQTAFAALLGDGTVKCWGNTTNGGTTPTDISNVDSIYCTNSAFTALLNDGNIVCWGDSTNGGTKPTNSDNIVSAETPINVTCDASGNFIFQDISSTELNLSFRTNHSNTDDIKTGLGFISGSSIYFKERGHDSVNSTYGKVFVSEIEFDTDVKNHTFVFKTFPYKTINNNTQIYIGFICDDGNNYTTYGNKYPTGIFTSQSNKNPYIYLNNPSWIYSGQHELTFTLADNELTVTGGSDITISNGTNMDGGKYRLVIQVTTGMLQLKNAFSTPYPKFEYGKKYIFDQSDSSNVGNTLKFSSSDISGLEYEKSKCFGTPGNVGAYTELYLTDDNIQQLYTYSNENGFTSGKKHKVIQFDVKRIVVTVVNDGGNKFVFDGDQNTKPTLNHNTLYIFDVSDSSNTGHPLSFSKNSSNLQDYNVNRTGTEGSENAIVTFKNNDVNNSNFYVFCKTHGLDMGSYYNPLNITNITKENIGDFEKIFSTQKAFAGLKKNGKIITWGDSSCGGSFPGETNFPPNLTNKYEYDITDVVKIGKSNTFTAININDGLIQSLFNLNSNNNLSYIYSDEDRNKLTYDISKIVFTKDDFGVLTKSGMVISFGNSSGSHPESVQHRINSNCIDIVSNERGFCVLKNDGTVVTWGSSKGGGVDSDIFNLTNVKKVVATQFSFAALKNDGSVQSWGYHVRFHNNNSGWNVYGEAWDTSEVADDIKSGVIDIYSNTYNFVAIKDDGTLNNTYKVITWGNSNASTSNSGIRNHDYIVDTSLLESGVKKVVLSMYSGVILKANNNAYVWGDISQRVAQLTPPSAQEKLASLINVKEIRCAEQAIAFLKYDGSVVSWGGQGGDYGGKVNDSTYGVRNYSGTVDATVLDSNIVQLYSNGYAFCALSNDGKVYCWGSSSYGGNPHHGSHGLPSHFDINNDLKDIVKVTGLYDINDWNRKPHYGGFAALKKDGQIVYWGYNSSSITGARINDISKNSFVDIIEYNYSGYNNYFALHSDGTIHSFGYNDNARNSPYFRHSDKHDILQDSAHFQTFVPGTFKAPKVVVRWDMERVDKYIEPTTKKNSNFVNVFSTDKAFAGLKKDGTIIVWGNDSYGGKQSDITGQYNAQYIFSNSRSFTAVKQDNTMCVWGGRGYGVLEATTTDINISSNLQEINSYIEPYRKSNLLAMFNVHADTRKILEESYNSNDSANIILNTDGTATTWGNTTHGGVSSNLTLTNVKEVVTGGKNMSVLKSDGTLATWSNNTDQSTTATNVKKVVSGLSGNVIALKADGTVEYWDPDLANWTLASNIDTAKLSDLSGVVDVFAFDNTFAALDKDDALTVWGHRESTSYSELAKHTWAGTRRTISDSDGDVLVTVAESWGVKIYYKNHGGLNNWGYRKQIYSAETSATVSIEGDYLVVGFALGKIYDENGVKINDGYIKIFKKDQGGSNNWGELKQIDDPVTDTNYYGAEVLIKDDYIFVGAWKDNSKGAVYIYQKNEGGADNWGQIKKLTASDAGNADRFGHTIDYDSNNLVIAAPFWDSSVGAAYIFGKDYDPLTPNDVSANAWGQIKILKDPNSDTTGYFGDTESIVVKGEYIYFPQTRYNTREGCVYIFKKNYDPSSNDISNNAWGLVKTLEPDTPLSGQWFGSSISMYDNTLAVGAWYNSDISSNAGAVYIFEHDGNDNWTQKNKITDVSGQMGDNFGRYVKITNNFLFVNLSPTPTTNTIIYSIVRPAAGLLTNISSKAAQLSSGVKEVIANSKVLIALKYDGTVVTQGDSTLGGDISNSDDQYKLYGGTADNIANVYLNNKFALALKKDRTCVYWGDISRNTTLFNTDISAFTNIRDIVYSNDVVIGLKYDGTIVGLGEKSKGGSPLSTIKNISNVFATTNNGFTALKTDGSFVVWGDTSYGGQL